MSTSASTWRSQSGYIWSLIGSAVGFANVLSFSAQVYKNGGGAFMIPYIIALFLLGIPMLVLEGLIGNKWKLPLVSAYGKQWSRIGKLLGWVSIFNCLTIGSFYIVLTGYSVAYTYFSGSNQIPSDSKTFFVDTFLKTTSTLTDFGQLSIPILLAACAVAAAAWFVLVRNIKDGVERICSIFMPLMAVIVTLFAIAVCFLPGGMEGWIYYLKPDFSKLLEANLWRDVFGQLFFSLSIGLGIIVGYSRYTGQKTNIARAMLYVALGDFAVSFISGFALFGCIAHISYTQQIPFDSVLTTDSTFEIGFVLFPKILKFFGPFLSQIIGTIFFFCIFIAGITGVFSIVESIAGNFEVEFNLSRRKAVSIVIGALMFLAVFFCMGNASHIIDALAPMVLGTNMLISGFALIIAFVYGRSVIQEDQLGNSHITQSFLLFALRSIAPSLLLIILIGNLWNEFQNFDLAHVVRWGWLGIVLALSGALVYYQQQKQLVLQSIS